MAMHLFLPPLVALFVISALTCWMSVPMFHESCVEYGTHLPPVEVTQIVDAQIWDSIKRSGRIELNPMALNGDCGWAPFCL